MITKPSQMTTLTAILEKLRLRKQDNEFKMTKEGLTAGKGKYYKPEELTIIKTYRFEGESDPADSTILYVIEGNDGMIGYSIDVYGANSNKDEKYDEFIRQVKMEDRDEQILFGE
jgi:hypothetical protein